MIPVVTPDEMAAIDAAAPEPVEELIARAGSAVAWGARKLMGGIYGRRVAVVAGKGNNGADGRVAAGRLRSWGARVQVIDPQEQPAEIGGVDLVIDAAYGTGLTRAYTPPRTTAPVLAVDIPSGVSGLTGELVGAPWSAARTITFAALKPGLVLEPGAGHTGVVDVVDIGLDVSRASAHLVTAADIRVPDAEPDAHKWQRAVWVIAGSPGMTGAASLAAAAAARGGAGYVRLSTPAGADAQERGSALPSHAAPVEVVGHPLDASWDLGDIDRFRAMVVGPGLGRAAGTLEQVARALDPDGHRHSRGWRWPVCGAASETRETWCSRRTTESSKR